MTSACSSKFCSFSKLYVLVDRTDLFKISKLVYGARVIVTSLYGNLQKRPVYSEYSELAGWLSVSVKVENLGDLFGTIDVIKSDSLGHLKSCRRDSILVTITQSETNRMAREGVRTGCAMETTLQKGNQWSLSIQYFYFKSLSGYSQF